MHPISALQTEWSVFSPDVERSAVGAAAALGVAFVPYSPLGRGFLTGAFTDASKDLSSSDFRQQMPRFSGDNVKANAALLEPLHKIAADRATTAQIALAWLQQRAQAHGLTVVPIPGTRKRSRLLENAAATRITRDRRGAGAPADRRPGGGRPLPGTCPSPQPRSTRIRKRWSCPADDLTARPPPRWTGRLTRPPGRATATTPTPRHGHVVYESSQFRAGIRAPAVGNVEYKRGIDAGVFS